VPATSPNDGGAAGSRDVGTGTGRCQLRFQLRDLRGLRGVERGFGRFVVPDVHDGRGSVGTARRRDGGGPGARPRYDNVRGLDVRRGIVGLRARRRAVVPGFDRVRCREAPDDDRAVLEPAVAYTVPDDDSGLVPVGENETADVRKHVLSSCS